MGRHDVMPRIRAALSLIVVAGVFLLGILAGTAYAYFSVSGDGSGAVSVGRMQVVRLVAVTGASPTTLLYPGHAADALILVSNPNDYAVSLVSVAGDGTITADSGHPGCTTTGVTFADYSGPAISIPANAVDYPIDLPKAVSMSSASSNGCQGAEFSIPVTISVERR